jgi:hypothetical protein
MLVGGIVTWSNKKQTSIVLSSTKPKYIVILKIITKAIWMYMSLHEFSFPQFASTTIYFDNQSVITFTTNLKFHSRSKHVDTQCHFTHDQILVKEITLVYEGCQLDFIPI